MWKYYLWGWPVYFALIRYRMMHKGYWLFITASAHVALDTNLFLLKWGYWIFVSLMKVLVCHGDQQFSTIVAFEYYNYWSFGLKLKWYIPLTKCNSLVSNFPRHPYSWNLLHSDEISLFKRTVVCTLQFFESERSDKPGWDYFGCSATTYRM